MELADDNTVPDEASRLGRLAAEVVPAWGGGALSVLGVSANAVFRVEGPDGPFVLRLTPLAHRRAEDVRVEVAFVDQAAAVGIGVARPLRASSGDWLVSVGDCTAAAFAWADGALLTAGGAGWTPAFLRAWGRHLGELHRLTTRFDAPVRWAWDEDPWWARRGELLADDAETLALAERSVDFARNAGHAPVLCHADHGPQNFRWDGNRLTTFDFDNLCRQPREMDLAVPLSVMRRAPAYEAWSRDLLAGYADVQPVPDGFVENRDRWLQHRAIYVLLSRLDRLDRRDEGHRKALAAFRERVWSFATGSR